MKIRKILLGVAAATFASVALAAPAAAAPITPFALPDYKCTTAERTGTWCLGIVKPNAGARRFQVTIDVTLSMSQADAQAIIDAPGDPFYAAMYGDDSPGNDFLFSVPLASLSASGSGLSARLTKNVHGNALDEDDYVGNRGDEVFGQITFRDPRIVGDVHTFKTKNINENF